MNDRGRHSCLPLFESHLYVSTWTSWNRLQASQTPKRFKHASYILRIHSSTFKGKCAFALNLSRRDDERARALTFNASWKCISAMSSINFKHPPGMSAGHGAHSWEQSQVFMMRTPLEKFSSAAPAFLTVLIPEIQALNFKNGEDGSRSGLFCFWIALCCMAVLTIISFLNQSVHCFLLMIPLWMHKCIKSYANLTLTFVDFFHLSLSTWNMCWPC